MNQSCVLVKQRLYFGVTQGVNFELKIELIIHLDGENPPG